MLSMFSLLAGVDTGGPGSGLPGPGSGSGGSGGSGGSSIFGEVAAPPGVANYNEQIAGAEGIGILLFISNLIRIFTIIAGLYVLINILYAGFLYISSSGDSKAHGQATGIFINSLIGLLIIVGSYALAGIIGLIFFGDATFIINPQICGPEGC